MADRKKVYLSKNNFIKSLFANSGYFCEHFPFCFNTNDLGEKWDTIKFDVYKILTETNLATSPFSISMNKEGLLRRQIFVPNIYSFINLAKYMEDNFDFILKKTRDQNSESRIDYITTFNYPSNYRDSIYTRNSKFVGYKYKLKLDISNCFNSIYTHSISWACVGKNDGKKMYNKIIPKSIDYNIGNEMDKLTRKLNDNQTNGILTGPFTSRIIAELILSRIDKELKTKFEYSFVRYVDDFNFYFLTEDEARSAISNIAGVLNEYNLLLNKEKIKIEVFPFDMLDNFSEEFRLSENNENVYQLMQKAFEYATKGNIGALKFLLKVLEGQKLPDNYVKPIFGILINSMITFPLLSPYIVNVIELYLPYMKAKDLQKQLNKLLGNEIQNNHDHEVLWLLYIMMKANIAIDKEHIKKILVNNNIMAIIMCLDYLTNNFTVLGFNSQKQVAMEFKEEINSLNKRLEKQTMLTKDWLFIYTVSKLNLRLDGRVKIGTIKNFKLYKVFAKKDINFYNSFYK